MKCPTCHQEVVDKVKDFGERAAARMEELWQLDVFDPPKDSTHPRTQFCLLVIEKIIERNGWSWALPYRGDGPPQWCGMTAGYAYTEAGLDKDWLPAYFASTIRLQCWATYQRWDRKSKANPKPATEERAFGSDLRLYVNLRKPFTVVPQRGDIVIVGDGDPSFGDHVTVCVAWDPGTRTFDTISGNGGGFGPTGNLRQGISRKSYTIGQAGYAPMFLIRAASSDVP